MIDLNTDKVILSKVLRRKGFILGKSAAIARTDVAVMSDGTIRVISYRRREFFDHDPHAPLVIAFVSRGASDESNFRQCVQRIREMESQFITEELPETTCP